MGTACCGPEEKKFIRKGNTSGNLETAEIMQRKEEEIQEEKRRELKKSKILRRKEEEIQKEKRIELENAEIMQSNEELVVFQQFALTQKFLELLLAHEKVVFSFDFTFTCLSRRHGYRESHVAVRFQKLPAYGSLADARRAGYYE